MSEGWFFFLLGVSASIPISVGAPYVNRFIDKRAARSSKARAARDAGFKVQAASLAKDRPGLYVYLLERLIQIAYIGALFGAISGVFFTVGQLDFTGSVLGRAAFFLGQVLVLLGAIIVLRIASGAAAMVREVRRVPRPSSPAVANTSGAQTPATPPPPT